MNQKNHYFIALLVIIVIVITITTYFMQDKKSQSDIVDDKPDNVYQINDDPKGIKFYISKDFQIIDGQELKEKNPNFIYGYKPKDVDEVGCYISQTKLLEKGMISTNYLKQGTLDQIKQGYTDAVLDKDEVIKFGDYDAVKLFISYKEDNKEIKLIEAVGTTDELTTFAFCSCPESLYEFYEPTFNQFIDSIEIY